MRVVIKRGQVRSDRIDIPADEVVAPRGQVRMVGAGGKLEKIKGRKPRFYVDEAEDGGSVIVLDAGAGQDTSILVERYSGSGERRGEGEEEEAQE